jgi:hypothetical protein
MIKKTVQYISDRVREETDLEDSEFVTDESMIRLFNEVRRQVRGRIISTVADEGNLLIDEELTFDSNKEAELPEDFHTVFNLIKDDTEFKPASLTDVIRGNRNKEASEIYCIKGNKIKLPKDSRIQSATLLYYPMPEDVESLEDEVEFLYDEDRWIVYQMTADIQRREETPNTEVLEKLKTIERNIQAQYSSNFKGTQRIVTKRRR